MKKLVTILLAMVLTACLAASALAEGGNVRFVESSSDFDIEMALPEGATVGTQMGRAQVSVVEILSEGLATVRISIAPSDTYDKESMNDLTDEEIETLKTLAGSQYDQPELTVDVTPSGNKYIHVCANSEYDMDSIFTLYMGYFVELTQWHDGDYAKITEADYAFMQQLLYNISFLPLEK